MTLVAAQDGRYRESLNLVASENVLSDQARRAMAGDMGHRYCIPPEGERPAAVWDYPNQRPGREIKRIAEGLAVDLFGGAIADVRPLSGNNAATILLSSAVRPGGTVASVPDRCGGHFATAAICADRGLRRVDLTYDLRAGRIDAQAAADRCVAEGVDLVFLDASTQLFPHPLAELRAALPSAIPIVYDASHMMGLIAGGGFQDPLAEGAACLQGSTHKSLFGPQKGLFVFTEDGPLARAVLSAITPIFVSNMHVHHVAALAVALAEAACFGPAYAAAVVANARALGGALSRLGHELLLADRGFTACHQLVWVVGDRDNAMARFQRLEAAGLHVNVIRVPYGRTEYGFRVGTAELTRRGMGVDEMLEVGQLLASAFADAGSGGRTAAAVASLSSRFAGLRYCFSRGVDESAAGRAGNLGRQP
jgi:glycine hydroxymethyltransferase